MYENVFSKLKSAGLLLGLSLVLHSGCTTTGRAPALSEEEFKKQEMRIEQRKNSSSVSLEEKVSFFTNDILENKVFIDKGFFLPEYINQKPPIFHLEYHALLISGLAKRYLVTKEDDIKELLDEALLGLLEADNLNNIKGYPPFRASPFENSVFPRATHANAYSQIFHALAFIEENLLSTEIISRIYSYFYDHDFFIKDVNKQPIVKANLRDSLSLKFNPSRTLDRSLLDVSAQKNGDSKTAALAKENAIRGRFFAPLHFSLFRAEIPTHSSSWLNLLKLSAINELSDKDYSSQISFLANVYEHEQNPLFEAIRHLAILNQDMFHIERRLEEFPLKKYSGRLVHSFDESLEIRENRYVKWRSKPEFESPVPLYMIGSEQNLFKRNLLTADRGNPSSFFTKRYFGLDFLQTYWMYQLAKKRSDSNEF